MPLIQNLLAATIFHMIEHKVLVKHLERKYPSTVANMIQFAKVIVLLEKITTSSNYHDSNHQINNNTLNIYFTVQKRIPKYDVEIQTYDKWSGPRPMNPNSTLRRISIYYYKTTVQVSTTSKLFSFSSFISSIGGNLGLFVGFSFISAILFICNMIEDATNNISFVLWY